MGRLIPAGTGLGAYKRLSIHADVPETVEPLPVGEASVELAEPAVVPEASE
jgi:hypothetical protein